MIIRLSRSMMNLNQEKFHREEMEELPVEAKGDDAVTEAEVAAGSSFSPEEASPSWLHFFDVRNKGKSQVSRKRRNSAPLSTLSEEANALRRSCPPLRRSFATDGELSFPSSAFPSSIVEEEENDWELDCEDDEDTSTVVSELTFMTYSEEKAQIVREEFFRRLKLRMLQDKNHLKDLTLQDREALLREVQAEQELKFQKERELERRRRREEEAIAEEKQDFFERLYTMRLEKEEVESKNRSSEALVEEEICSPGKDTLVEKQGASDTDQVGLGNRKPSLESLEELSQSRRASLGSILAQAQAQTPASLAQKHTSTVGLQKPGGFINAPSQACPPRRHHSKTELRRTSGGPNMAPSHKSSMESFSSVGTMKYRNASSKSSMESFSSVGTMKHRNASGPIKRNFSWTRDGNGDITIPQSQGGFIKIKDVASEQRQVPAESDPPAVNPLRRLANNDPGTNYIIPLQAANKTRRGSGAEDHLSREQTINEDESHCQEAVLDHHQPMHSHEEKHEASTLLSLSDKSEKSRSSRSAELHSHIGEIIELKLLVAEQQATIDTLSSRLHNLELANRKIAAEEASKTKDLEARNMELEHQLAECREQKISQSPRQSFWVARKNSNESNQSSGSGGSDESSQDGKNRSLMEENLNLKRQLEELRHQLDCSWGSRSSSDKTKTTAASTEDGDSVNNHTL